MTDQVMPEPGALPWKPSSGAELVEVFDRYDRPLIGLVREGGSEHLFACVAGRTDDWNAWVYTRIDADERKLLEETEASDFDSALAMVVRGKACVLAVASEEGIVDTSFVEHADELPGTLATLLRWVGRSLRHGAAESWIASGVNITPPPSAFHRSVISPSTALTEVQNRSAAFTAHRRQNEELDYESNAAALAEV